MIEVPDVSVIVPVFNAGKGLEATLRTLLNQTLKNIEIIIVNDASTDNSADVINLLAAENDNIVPIHLTENMGVYEARLTGIKRAAAPWLGFVDADDFVHPGMFEVMLGAAKKHDVDIVVCGANRVTPERKPIGAKVRFECSKKVDTDVFEKFCRFEFGTGMLCNRLYRRDVITPYADMHFPWRQNMNEDLLLNIGCFHKADSVYLSDEILYDYVLNPSSVTSTTNNLAAYVELYRAYALAVSNYSKLGSDVICNIIEMYRIQLLWEVYQVDNINEILVYEPRLKEAVDLIYQSYPIAAAVLTVRQRSVWVRSELTFKSIVHRLLSALGPKLNSTLKK